MEQRTRVALRHPPHLPPRLAEGPRVQKMITLDTPPCTGEETPGPWGRQPCPQRPHRQGHSCRDPWHWHAPHQAPGSYLIVDGYSVGPTDADVHQHHPLGPIQTRPFNAGVLAPLCPEQIPAGDSRDVTMGLARSSILGPFGHQSRGQTPLPLIPLPPVICQPPRACRARRSRGTERCIAAGCSPETSPRASHVRCCSPSFPVSKQLSSPCDWSQSGEAPLGFSEVLAPTKSRGALRELGPSAKGRLNSAGLDSGDLSLGVADVRVLLHGTQTSQLCREGAGGLQYMPTPHLMALSRRPCAVSHPFSGWTVMARGLSSP